MLAAFNRYAGKVPPLSMVVLTYMAAVSKDADDWPFFRLGQPALAEMALGRPNPGDADLRALQRALKPLFEVGALTVDRAGAARAGGNVTARYRLNLTERHDQMRKEWESTPDGIRRVSKRAEDPRDPTVCDGDARRFVTRDPTVSDETSDGNRRTQEYLGVLRSDKTKEEGFSETASHPPRASEPIDTTTEKLLPHTRPWARRDDIAQSITEATERRAKAVADYQARLAAGETE